MCFFTSGLSNINWCHVKLSDQRSQSLSNISEANALRTFLLDRVSVVDDLDQTAVPLG